MEILNTLLWIVMIISAVAIVILVLLQQGKGADAGALLVLAVRRHCLVHQDRPIFEPFDGDLRSSVLCCNTNQRLLLKQR